LVSCASWAKLVETGAGATVGMSLASTGQGLFQALERGGLKRDVAVTVTHFMSIPEIVAATDYCATLPKLICRRLASDARLKVLPAPVDLGTFPMQMAWHVRYRDDPAHVWLRGLVTEVAASL